MKTWKTDLVTVKETAFDHDLHIFNVYNNDDELLGTVLPDTIEDMNQCIADLNEGSCPVADEWEDGTGNTCTIEGWK